MNDLLEIPDEFVTINNEPRPEPFSNVLNALISMLTSDRINN